MATRALSLWSITALLTGVLFAASNASPASGGKVWYVGGPNSDFDEIYEAISAAEDGDTIVAVGGNYDSFVLYKSLHIIGTDGATVQGTVFILDIDDTVWGAGVSGLEIRDGSLRVGDCTGEIVVEDIHGNGDALPEVEIDRCDNVVLHGFCHDEIRPPDFVAPVLRTRHSRVRLTDCSITGHEGRSDECDFIPGGPGCEFIDSRVELVRSQVQGGDGVTPDFCGDGDGGHGIIAVSSHLLIHGNTAHTVRGGHASGDDYSIAGDGLTLDASSTALVSRVAFEGGDGGASGTDGLAVSGPGLFTRQDLLADLRCETDFHLGATISLDLDSATPGLVFLFLSDHSGFVELPGFLGPDLSVLQGGSFFAVLPVGGTDRNGQLHRSFTAPSDPCALGLVGHLQAALLPGDPGVPPILSNAISGAVRE